MRTTRATWTPSALFGESGLSVTAYDFGPGGRKATDRPGVYNFLWKSRSDTATSTRNHQLRRATEGRDLQLAGAERPFHAGMDRGRCLADRVGARHFREGKIQLLNFDPAHDELDKIESINPFRTWAEANRADDWKKAYSSLPLRPERASVGADACSDLSGLPGGDQELTSYEAWSMGV